jgi:hypothetical protein
VLALTVAALVLLALGGAGGYFAGHRSSTKTLDPAKVAAGVTHVLEADYGLSNVSDTSCPSGMQVRKDARYTCTFTAGAAKGSVDIVVQNDAGQYLVKGPKG